MNKPPAKKRRKKKGNNWSRNKRSVLSTLTKEWVRFWQTLTLKQQNEILMHLPKCMGPNVTISSNPAPKRELLSYFKRRFDKNKVPTVKEKPVLSKNNKVRASESTIVPSTKRKTRDRHTRNTSKKPMVAAERACATLDKRVDDENVHGNQTVQDSSDDLVKNKKPGSVTNTLAPTPTGTTRDVPSNQRASASSKAIVRVGIEHATTKDQRLENTSKDDDAATILLLCKDAEKQQQIQQRCSMDSYSFTMTQLQEALCTLQQDNRVLIAEKKQMQERIEFLQIELIDRLNILQSYTGQLNQPRTQSTSKPLAQRPRQTNTQSPTPSSAAHMLETSNYVTCTKTMTIPKDFHEKLLKFAEQKRREGVLKNRTDERDEGFFGESWYDLSDAEAKVCKPDTNGMHLLDSQAYRRSQDSYQNVTGLLCQGCVRIVTASFTTPQISVS